MLRTDDLADLALWLRERALAVSSQQLVAAAALQARMGVTIEEEEFGPWLAPIFCTNGTDQAQFVALYREWLAMRRDRPAPKPAAPRGVGIRQWVARRLMGWGVALLLFVFTGIMALLAYYSATHSVAITVLGNDARGNDMALRGAVVRLRSSGATATTDGEGHAVLAARRWQLTTEVEATHRDYSLGERPRAFSASISPETTDVTLHLRREWPAVPAPERSVLGRRVHVLAAPANREAFETAVPARRAVDPYAALLLLCIVLLTAGWWMFATLRRHGFLTRLPAYDDDVSWHFDPALTPELSSLSINARFLGRALRRRHAVPSRTIDVPATVAATIRNCGQWAPVYGTRAEPEYLALVDTQGPRDHQMRLSDEVIRVLVEQGVAIERYEFDGNPNLAVPAPLKHKPLHLGALSLDALFVRHPMARLFVFGEANCMLDRYTGRLWGWFAGLRRWPGVAVITPLSRAQWGRSETLVQEAGVRLVPLDEEGLRALAAVFGDPATVDQASKATPARRSPPHFQDAHELLRRRPPSRIKRRETMEALASDLPSRALTWLAGCAVYPEVHWPLTLAVGDAIREPIGGALRHDGAEQAAADKAVHERDLARLARMPWFRAAYMPEWVRQALLSKLSRDQESAVRQRLADFLAGVTRMGRGKEPAGLNMATREPVSAWRDVWTGLKAWGRRDPRRRVVEDRVFLRFMSGPRPRLAFDPGAAFRLLLYRHGARLAGPRPTALVLAIALCIAVAWRWPPWVPIEFHRPMRIVQPAPVLAALSFDGARLAVADSSGGALVLQATVAPAAGTSDPQFDGTCAETRVDALRDLRFSGAELQILADGPLAADRRECGTTVLGASVSVATDVTLLRPEGEAVVKWADRSATPSELTSPDWLCAVPRVGSHLLLHSNIARRLLPGNVEASACGASSDGSRLAVLSSGGGARQLKLYAKDPIIPVSAVPILGDAAKPTAMAVSDDGRTLAVTREDGSIAVWKNGMSNWRTLGKIHARPPLALSGDGMTLAFGDSRREVQVWRLDELPPRNEILMIERGVVSPDEGFMTAILGPVVSGRYGYKVTSLRNPSEVSVRSALDSLATHNRRDRLIIYISESESQTIEFGSSLLRAIERIPASELMLIVNTPGSVTFGARGLPDPSNQRGAKSRKLLTLQGQVRGTALLAKVLNDATSPMSGEALAEGVRELADRMPPNRRIRVAYTSLPAAGHTSGDVTLAPLTPMRESFLISRLVDVLTRQANQSPRELPATQGSPPAAPPAPPAPVSEKVTFAADAYFDFDMVVLKPESRAKLDDLVAKSEGINLEVIIAVGHSDSSEPEAQSRSVRRAEAVKSYLASKGVELNRIYTEGKGAEQPTADNRSAEGRAKNRRVEIEVVGTRTRK